MSPPTPAELSALWAYVQTGSTKAAAQDLGLAESTIKNHLAALRRRLHAKTTAEVVYVLMSRTAA